MGRPKKEKEYAQSEDKPFLGVPADKPKRTPRECFLHGEQIEGKEFMVGLDKPYVNLYFCEEGIRELKSNGNELYEQWFDDHVADIYLYAEQSNSYINKQKSKLMDKKGKK